MAAMLFASGATGAGLNLIFEEFLKLVKETVKHNILFKHSLKSLEETLNRLEPTVKKIDAYNRELDRPNEIEGLRKLIEKGHKLVEKCLKVNKFNFVAKPYYNRELMKLKNKIEKFVNFDVGVNQALDQKETLFEVKQLSSKFQRLITITANSEVGVGVVGFGVGVCSPPGLREDPVGLEVPLKELKEKLLKDEKSASLTVICGLGGSGKTTLAISLCHDEEVKEKFKHNILFVRVSKKPDLFLIIRRLFQHKGGFVPEFHSKEDAVHQLEQLLKRTAADCPILMVLDDVWPDSRYILEDLMFPIRNYKIVVTSRSEFTGFGSTYKLQTLSHADAMKLFCHTALMQDGVHYMPHRDLVTQIVKSCGGFPLAISVIGKSLRGRHAAVWQKKAEECSRIAILSDVQLLELVQSSVDELGSEVNECFKDLGSFPENQRIPATTLLDMWIERHKLEEYSAIANLHEIADRSLVDLVVVRKIGNEVDGSYNEHFVKQHDLMRELAILQSNSGDIDKRGRVFLETSKGELPDWVIKENQQTISAKLLSISTDNKFLSNWGSIQAPDVEVLLLHFQSEDYSLPQFMENMDKLKVLIITNCSFFPTELGNFPLLVSLSNLKRIRLENIALPSYFLSSIKLPTLEKLSLVMCNVAQAFSNRDIQVMATLPNLMEIYIDYCNDLTELPVGICYLVALKKLIVTKCQKLTSLPQEIGNMENLEVLKLRFCIELTDFPNTIGDLRNLRILDISGCLNITELPKQIGALQNLTKLCMIYCSGCKLPSTVRNLINLKELISDEETATSLMHHKNDLPNLEIKVHKDI